MNGSLDDGRTAGIDGALPPWREALRSPDPRVRLGARITLALLAFVGLALLDLVGG